MQFSYLLKKHYRHRSCCSLPRTPREQGEPARVVLALQVPRQLRKTLRTRHPCWAVAICVGGNVVAGIYAILALLKSKGDTTVFFMGDGKPCCSKKEKEE